MMMTVLIVAVIGVCSLYVVEKGMKSAYLEKRDTLTNEMSVISEVEDSFGDMILRIRGYIALQNEAELQKGEEAYKELSLALREFDAMDTSPNEEAVMNEIRAFTANYWDELVPQVRNLVNQEDYEGIQDISTSGATDTINELYGQLGDLEANKSEQIAEAHNTLMNRLDYTSFSMILFIALLLAVLSLATKNMSRRIGVPLQELSLASERIAAGDEVQLEAYRREDELGTLSRAFSHMARIIQERETDLQAHNEELMAQQDELTEQQERLEHSLNDVRNLNTAINEATILSIIDLKGKAIYVNDKFCEVSKYSTDELIGKDRWMLNSEYHEDSFFKTMSQTISKGGTWKGEVRNQAKDGTYYWVDTTIVPYKDEEDKIEKYVIIQFDITKIKEAEADLMGLLEQSNRQQERLHHFNELNHALSITLEKGPLMDKVLQQLSQIFDFEKGLLYLEESDDVASMGIHSNDVERFMAHRDTNLAVRLKETGKPHIVTRQASPEEQGYLSSTVLVYDAYAPIFDSDGTLVAVFVCTRIGLPFRDEELDELIGVLNRVSLSFEKIFLYEETEANRQLNQDVIDNVNEAIQFVDSNGELVQLNDKLQDLIPISTDNTNMKFEEWLQQFESRTDDPEQLRTHFYDSTFTIIETPTSFRFELHVPHRRVIEAYAQTIFRHQTKVGTLFVHRDITSEYEVDQMKSELVSTVSHELRTPLASVLGFTELMLKRELKPERQKRYLETIHKEADRLTNLINDFLDVQRMEAGKQTYEKQEVNLAEVASEVLEGFRVNHNNHRFEIYDHSSSHIVHADRSKMIQLYTNLISNAVKFSPNGGDVIVSLTNNEESLYIHIADDGLGIPDGELPKLFKKFHRIDNSDRRKIGGTGLGLSICKEIVEAHGGKISVRSEIGEGSVFTIQLPLQHRAVTRQPTGEVDHQLPLVMVVEDDYSLSLLFKDELQDAGMNVLHCTSGESALHALKDSKPDAFVVDVMLGDGMNGWEFIEQVKEHPNLSRVPIVVSTALDEQLRGEKLGVHQYLTKPYPPNKLATALLHTLLKEEKQGQIMVLDQETRSDS